MVYEGAAANRHPPRDSAERRRCLTVGFAFDTQERVPVAELESFDGVRTSA